MGREEYKKGRREENRLRGKEEGGRTREREEKV